jgi:hypothetical protein
VAEAAGAVAEARAAELAEAALAVAPAAELEAAREAALAAAREAAPGAALAEEAQAQAVADRAEGSITPLKTSPGRRSRRT